MVKFIAYDQVDLTYLLGLGHLADTGASDISGRSSHGFKIHQGDGPVRADFYFRGHDIKYIGGVPWSGTVTSLLVKINDANAYAFSGTSMSVKTAWQIYRMDDPLRIAQKVLSGSDSITGSHLDDTLPGFGGNDTIHGGDGKDNISGGSGSDRLFGEGGDDHINGGRGRDVVVGGDGNDVLTGGADHDRFVFNAALDKDTNVDEITDFVHGIDKIVLASAVFTGLNPGALPGDAFALAGSETSTTRIVYDGATGTLSFDQDGAGGADPVAFAVLSNLPSTLGAGDFLIT